ncbi:hypothetical protein BKA69DRAFT_1179479 [Paraphysoderma sedebokerense]|nr:hypothetical protein BKA69DRAFT_1179479 [Paraphysoderma sedebokerense]
MSQSTSVVLPVSPGAMEQSAKPLPKIVSVKIDRVTLITNLVGSLKDTTMEIIGIFNKLKLLILFQLNVIGQYKSGPPSETMDGVFYASVALILIIAGQSLVCVERKKRLCNAYFEQQVLIDFKNWSFYRHGDFLACSILSVVISVLIYIKFRSIESLNPIASQVLALVGVIYSDVVDFESKLTSFSELVENKATRHKLINGWSNLEVVTEECLIAYLNFTKNRLHQLVRLYKQPPNNHQVRPSGPMVSPFLISRDDILKFRETSKDLIEPLSLKYSVSFKTPYGSESLIPYYIEESKSKITQLNNKIRKSAVIRQDHEMKLTKNTEK